MERLNNLLTGDYPDGLKNLVLGFLLVLVTVSTKILQIIPFFTESFFVLINLGSCEVMASRIYSFLFNTLW